MKQSLYLLHVQINQIEQNCILPKYQSYTFRTLLSVNVPAINLFIEQRITRWRRIKRGMVRGISAKATN